MLLFLPNLGLVAPMLHSEPFCFEEDDSDGELRFTVEVLSSDHDAAEGRPQHEPDLDPTIRPVGEFLMSLPGPLP